MASVYNTPYHTMYLAMEHYNMHVHFGQMQCVLKPEHTIYYNTLITWCALEHKLCMLQHL